MPHLHWIGKERVIHHHNDVRYRPLVAKETFGDQEAAKGNMIIHGDNLEALKSLLPKYEGRVDCIYIDPPYNTGNEGWVYNDNVNHPKIKKWLGEVVGKEGEDLSRHDKWLCMMYPRMKLLQRLLSPDGVIFISIDDNEQHNLRSLMNEIWGEDNFVASIIWRKNYAPKSTAKHFSEDHDYILVYARDSNTWLPNLMPRSDKQNDIYRNRDNDPRGPWRPNNLAARNYYSKGTYAIKCPGGRTIEGPPSGSYWRYSEEKFWELDRDGRIYWGEDGNNVPAPKIFLSEVKNGIVPQTYWPYEEVGHTQEAKKELLSILQFDSSDDVFVSPKPTRLLERIVKLGSSENSVILDSFAGSATTAHAVMKANHEDGGNRQYIMIEMEDYADTITAERVRRVIKGYGQGDKAVEGLGGGFTFYDLGAPMFDEKGNLSDPIDLPKLREYVWYVETKAPYKIQAQPEYLGCFQGIGYYLLMDDSGPIPLTYGTLGKITQKQDGYVIYGESCALSEEFLQKNHITFKKIPNQLARI